MENAGINGKEIPEEVEGKIPESQASGLQIESLNLPKEEAESADEAGDLQGNAISQRFEAKGQKQEAESLQSGDICQQPGAKGLEGDAMGLHGDAMEENPDAKAQQCGAVSLKPDAMGQKNDDVTLHAGANGHERGANGLQRGAMRLKAGALGLHAPAVPLTWEDRRQRDFERFGKGNIAFLNDNDILMPFTERITMVFTSEDTVKDYLYTIDLSDHYYERTIKTEAERTIKYLNAAYERVIPMLNLTISRKTFFHLFKSVRSALKKKKHDFILPGKITNILLYGSLFYGFYYSDIEETFKYPRNSLTRIFKKMKQLNWLKLQNNFANRYFFISQEGRNFLNDKLNETAWTPFMRKK